ncbi:ATP-binding protein [Myxococcus sp. AS-1-15]|uniref:ATP-binding protein n=1 Tax=Myxococcus sp. AS-1-15 TaxID=2874600 RepID=UPI001CBFF9D9|nr:ATP-binding protein [Myxococcus sp. AS-1-15]MBZ4397552.1 ATP-binding protein [Myxococcus sp. AS-1-15]
MSQDDKREPRRLADLLRRGMSQAKQQPSAGLAQLEADWKQRELERQRAAEEAKARHASAQVHAWPLHLEQCGAPAEAVAGLRGETPLETAALRAARHVLRERLRSLLLSGGPGTGKTTGACYLFRAAVRGDRGLSAWDSSAGLFIDWARLSREEDSEARRRLLQRAAQVRVLVLDDIGGEASGPRQRELLESLVEQRDRPDLVTAYTTRLSVQRREGGPSRFAESVGARVVQRMSRQGTFHLADCGNRDLRQGGKP